MYATYLDGQQREHTIRSKFLVGADGKTGFTRKQYLEPLGVELLWAEKYVIFETVAFLSAICNRLTLNLKEQSIKRHGSHSTGR